MTGQADENQRRTRPDSDGSVTRRRLLAGLGGTALLSSSGTGAGRPGVVSTTPRTASEETPTVHVRVYPGPVSVVNVIRDGLSRFWSGWSEVHRDAINAVRSAMAQIEEYAAQQPSLPEFSVRVDAAEPIDLPSSSASLFDFPMRSRSALLSDFRSELHNRQAITGSTCHLLLWWNPLNNNLGYGGTRKKNPHVAAVEEEGSQTVTNVGATEFWDTRAVSRNMAIHETLHTFLSSSVVEEVIDSRCEHDLGSAIRTDATTMRVSPMGTAYAGPDRIGGGTRWHGTGCYDHDSFYEHDGYEGIERWEYTTELSEGTLEAVTRYIDRNLI